MKKEIIIDGIRYVPAEEPKKYDFSKNITELRELVIETDTSCFEFSVIINDDGKAVMPSVDYTDKKKPIDEWEQEIWDNEIWLKDVLATNGKSKIDEVDLSEEDMAAFIQLLRTAKEKGMLG